MQEHPIEEFPLRTLMLPKTDRTYLVLRHLEQQHETTHATQRSRNGVAGKDRSAIPQRAHGYVRQSYGLWGMILDAVRYCLRAGWIKAPYGTVREPKVVEPTLKTYDKLADELERELLRARRDLLLHMPYGPGAKRFGGFAEPPSHRTARAGPYAARARPPGDEYDVTLEP